MADIANETTDLPSQSEAPVEAAASEVKPRGSVRDTIAAIDAELARHEPSTPTAPSASEI